MNKYKRALRIKYWCVSLDDIKIIYEHLNRRMKECDINLDAEFVSRNNIHTKDIKTLLEIIGSRIKEKDDLNKIFLSFHGQESNILKILLMSLEFSSDYSSFFLEASDFNGELKDWVAGTYEEFEKMRKQFEIEEKYKDYLNKKYVKKGLDYPIIFDPFGEIKKEILEQDKIKKDEKIPIVINGNNTIPVEERLTTNPGPLSKLANRNSGLINSHNNIEVWYKTWWGQLIIIILSGLILSFLVYKIGWNR